MDTNSIGMVDFARFSTTLKMQMRHEIPRAGANIEDSFEWQEKIIGLLR